MAAALPALTGLTFDGDKVVYTGESFGSIIGATVLAVDPLLEAAVLDVGGGGLFIDCAQRAEFAPMIPPFLDRCARHAPSTSTIPTPCLRSRRCYLVER